VSQPATVNIHSKLVWTSCVGVNETDRQTDKLIAVLCTATGSEMAVLFPPYVKDVIRKRGRLSYSHS